MTIRTASWKQLSTLSEAGPLTALQWLLVDLVKEEGVWEAWWQGVRAKGHREIAAMINLATSLAWQLSQFWLEVALFPGHIPKSMLVYKLQAMASTMRRSALPGQPWLQLEKVIAELLKRNDPEIRWVLDKLQHIRPCRELSWVGEFWSNDELHAHVEAFMPDLEVAQCSTPVMMMKHFPADFRDGLCQGKEVTECQREVILQGLSQTSADGNDAGTGDLDDSREEEMPDDPSPVPSPPRQMSPVPVREPMSKKVKRDKYRLAPEYANKTKVAVLFNRDSLKGIPEGVRKQLGRWTFGK